MTITATALCDVHVARFTGAAAVAVAVMHSRLLLRRVHIPCMVLTTFVPLILFILFYFAFFIVEAVRFSALLPRLAIPPHIRRSRSLIISLFYVFLFLLRAIALDSMCMASALLKSPFKSIDSRTSASISLIAYQAACHYSVSLPCLTYYGWILLWQKSADSKHKIMQLMNFNYLFT